MDSILDTIKDSLDIDITETLYDTKIKMFINTSFMKLKQLGVGPVEGYKITGKENVWSEFTADVPTLEAVQTYIFLAVTLLFDPPPTSYAIQSFTDQLLEIEWRLKTEYNKVYPVIEETTEEGV